MKSLNITIGIFTIGINSNASINNSFTEIINIRTPAQFGGSIRIIPALDNNEASIGYYNYNDARWTTTGDAWVAGINCWDKQGYSIGTPVLNNCLNITLDGNLDAAYGLTTPAITVNNISASTSEYLNIGDNAVITGYLSVGGDVNLARTLYVRTPQQGGGNIRIYLRLMVMKHL